MASTNKDAIIIVLDVGKSVSQLHYWEDKTFFQQARDCVSWILQRKIISQSKDLLTLLLIGSEESNNILTISGYKNISCKFDFQQASWDMLKFIENEIQTTELLSDWLGALIVSLEMLKTFEEFNLIQNKKIVFFSDFTNPASDDLEVIAKSIKALEIEITIIGPDNICFIPEDEPVAKKKKTEKSQERQEGERLIYEMWKKMKTSQTTLVCDCPLMMPLAVIKGETSGMSSSNQLPENIWICTFESALKQLCSYIRKSMRATPWNCIMDIGDVKINISLLKKTDPKSAKKFNTKCIKPSEEPSTSIQVSLLKSDDTSHTIRDKVMHYKHATGDGGEFVNVEVKQEDTIEGYRYGTTVIPFSEEDKTVLEYKSGPKCFSVIGFTSLSSVPYYLLSGESSYIVIPRDKDQNAELALSALIQAMKKMHYLGIIRRVYSDDRGLSLGILYPIIEEIVCDETDEITHKECLLYVELAFKEDIKPIKFPSLRQIVDDLSKEQLEAVDELIDGMNLMKADKGLRGELSEAFELSSLHDFKEQFFQYCVIQRGLHPDRPLPKSLPPYIENFIKQPKQIQEKCDQLIKEIKKYFKIEVKEKVTEKESKSLKQKKQTDLTEDINPTRDFTTLVKLEHFAPSTIKQESHLVNRRWMEIFSKGFPTEYELEKFIARCLEEGTTDETEIFKSFQLVFGRLRKLYLKVDPEPFNSWLIILRDACAEKKGSFPEIWEALISGNLGLISKKDNPQSRVSEETAEEIFCEESTTLITMSETKKKPDFKPLPDAINELEAEQMEIDSFF